MVICTPLPRSLAPFLPHCECTSGPAQVHVWILLLGGVNDCSLHYLLRTQPYGIDISHKGELLVTDAYKGTLHVLDLPDCPLSRPDDIKVPCSTFSRRMAMLLESGEGADVTFEARTQHNQCALRRDERCIHSMSGIACAPYCFQHRRLAASMCMHTA